MKYNKLAIPKRSEIPQKYKWNLDSMYSSKEAWEYDINMAQKMAKEVVMYAGKLGYSSQNLYRVLSLDDEISKKLENVYVYAKMKKDEDNTNAKYQAMSDKAQSVSVEIQSQMSFITPELTNISEETIYKFMREEPKLSMYKFFFEELFRQKRHILSKDEESLLAQFGEITSAPKTIFSMINNADMKFKTIVDENGQSVELTKGRYISFLESSDRRVRKDAFETLYKSYDAQKNTLSSTYSYSVKKDVFYAKVRKYNSALEASLDSDNIPVNVYDNLIKTVESHLPSLYKYLELRKKALKLDSLHMYDLYTPIVSEMDMKINFEEAKDMVLKGLSPLGDEYSNILKKGFDSGWIDVYENEGKTSGAYSFGSYESAPFVMLNYQNTINDVFTLAHEMGHSLHSYYTRRTQPYVYGSYKIFVAEVASTVNEALLMNYLLKTTTDRQKKMYLLNHYLEQFRGTIYRQTMFAKFEKMAHEMVERGQSLTADTLCDMYRHLNMKFFGDNVVIDDLIKVEWSRIPHFYNAFYVYKYATGFSAAISLSNQILNGGQNAVNRYLNFLKSGGSDYPINLLKGAGVDMTKTEPIDSALETFGNLVDEMAKMM